MIRTRILLTICMFAFSFVYTQQEPVFSQYYVNKVILNPAISGSQQHNTLLINSRTQWLGFNGSPVSTNIAYHGALNNRSAIGAHLMYDKVGPSMRSDLVLSYAYHIPLDYDKINLSFGIGTKLMYYNLNFNNINLPPAPDNAFSNKTYTKTIPEASSGVYLYGRNFYFGYSNVNLLESTFKDPLNDNFPNLVYRTHYAVGGYRFDVINNDWELEPSFLVRKKRINSSVTDFTIRLIYLKNTWGGLNYRNDGNIGINFGFGSGNINFCYSYDHTFKGDISEYNYGTHELSIEFSFETLGGKRHISFWEY